METRIDEAGHISVTTQKDVPALVLILEADAPLKAIYPGSAEERRRVLLNLNADQLEGLAKLVGIDLGELMDEPDDE